MAVVLKIRKETADLYIGQNKSWTKVFINSSMVSSQQGVSNNFNPLSGDDGISPITFYWMKEDEILKQGSKATIEVYKGTRFGKKVPNNWSVIAKLLEIGFPLVDVPKSGVIWEWTRDDLYAYAEKLQKAIAAYKPGITINKLEDVLVSVP